MGEAQRWLVLYRAALSFTRLQSLICGAEVVDASIRWDDVEGAWVKLNAGLLVNRLFLQSLCDLAGEFGVHLVEFGH